MDRIGIIGGGVGGLAVAWNLYYKLKDAGITPDINVFEANSRFGGNADTKTFNFGKGPGSEDKDLIRWADMGVNDFNIPAYKNIVEVMKQIGYTKENGNFRALEDSTTYYDTKGNAFTANSTPDGKPDPWWGTAMPADLASSVADFMEVAGKDFTDFKYHDYTVEQYIDEMSPKHKWHPDLGPKVIYPRINGMYFTSSVTGPRAMPFVAVMHYYHIQEGVGGGKADRNYFVNGSSTWIDALVAYMEKWPGMTLHLNRKVWATPSETGPGYEVRNETKDGDTDRLYCRYICLATPADSALQVMASTGATDPATTGLPQQVSNILSQVKYETAVSVAHTDTRLLPVERNAWSTYNIVIHEPGSVALKPYVINYVANRHQNDAANPEFNKFGSPEFFLSINPHIPISKDKVLTDTDGNPAVANLRHFVFDFDCMTAQYLIKSWQGKNNIFYASGWTAGSGLHTECWTQGEDVAGWILKAVQSEAEEVVQEQTQSKADFITSRLIAAGAHS